MRRILAAAGLLLAGCFTVHHPLSSYRPSGEDDPQPTLPAMLKARLPAVAPCEGEGGRRYLRFHDQQGVLIHRWAYDIASGELLWVDVQPWEGTPCPCVDMVIPRGDTWGREPKMTCGTEIEHPTGEDLRQFAPEAFGTSP